jgi:hypothetical protein
MSAFGGKADIDGTPSDVRDFVGVRRIESGAVAQRMECGAALTALWEKFVLLAANSSVSTLTRLPFGKCATIPTCLPCSKRPPPR